MHLQFNPHGTNDYNYNGNRKPLFLTILKIILIIVLIYFLFNYVNVRINDKINHQIKAVIGELENHILENIKTQEDLFSNRVFNNNYIIYDIQFTRAEVRHTEFFKRNSGIDGNEFVFFSSGEKYEIIIFTRQNSIEIIGFAYPSDYIIKRELLIKETNSKQNS